MTPHRYRADITSFLGMLVGAAGIVGGLLLDGGMIRDLTQLSPALIVLGGTMGAVAVSTPGSILLRALKRTRDIFVYEVRSEQEIIAEIVEYAIQARRLGLISLEGNLPAIDDLFFRKAMALAVDGVDEQEIRTTMELEQTLFSQDAEVEAAVFESAGGYAPTIGILGAVLGLIQVMKHLTELELVGSGIAVAFVATIYGVGVANLLLIPAAYKLRSRTAAELRWRQLMLEGTLLIVEGLNPKLIRTRLEAFVNGYLEDGRPYFSGLPGDRSRRPDSDIRAEVA